MNSRTAHLLAVIGSLFSTEELKDCRQLIDANEFGAALHLMQAIVKSRQLKLNGDELKEFDSLDAIMQSNSTDSQ